MDQITQVIAEYNERINAAVWGTPMLVLMLATGVYLTVRSRFFQLRHIPLWFSKTFLALFKNKKVTSSGDGKALSQFQALATALAATIGTGNIAGVATAITLGGPGAIFWMWVSALFGMMTSYAEKVLGIYYRRRNADGEWSGGAMYYIREGLRWKGLGKVLAALFAMFCILASFGIGNMTQVNNIATSLEYAFAPILGFRIPPLATGIVLAVLAALVILGGLQRLGKVTEKLVPVMAVAYIAGTLFIFFSNISSAPAVFSSIFRGAFGLQAAGAGFTGAMLRQAVSYGFKRGIFSNEAGLGGSVMIHSTADVKEPVEQGMWGIFEVFFDTMIVCTLTAFAVLSSGVVDLDTGNVLSSLEGTQMVTYAFSQSMGQFAGIFIAVATLFFSFSTLVGWSFYGTKCTEYLMGGKAVSVYKALFVLVTVIGATIQLELAWGIADTLNGLMAIPNLIALLLLSGTVMKITRNYHKRKISAASTGSKPMLSAYEDIQNEQEWRLMEDE